MANFDLIKQQLSSCSTFPLPHKEAFEIMQEEHVRMKRELMEGSKHNPDEEKIDPEILSKLRTKLKSMNTVNNTKSTTNIADELEKERVAWFINQGKCPYCGTKLKRGKKDKNHIRRWWCIKDNIYLSKE